MQLRAWIVVLDLRTVFSYRKLFSMGLYCYAEPTRDHSDIIYRQLKAFISVDWDYT